MRGQRNEPKESGCEKAQPLTAWEQAEAERIDMSLVEIALAQTPAERIRRNNGVAQFAWKLRQAMEAAK